jgi:hypothetical protein
MKFMNGTLAAAAVSLLMLGTVSIVSADGGGGNGFRVRTQLSGSPIKGVTPSGHVEFRIDDKGRRRLNVEVENVNMPMGTTLTVHILEAGSQLTLTPNQFKLREGANDGDRDNRGELEDQTEDGDIVPNLRHGDFIIHVSAGGHTILSGALHD